MSDIHRLLERQARWQKARKALSWPEKIRMAELIRESARQLRAEAGNENQAPSLGSPRPGPSRATRR